jgi:hypothetical protein
MSKFEKKISFLFVLDYYTLFFLLYIVLHEIDISIKENLSCVCVSSSYFQLNLVIALFYHVNTVNHYKVSL